VTARAIWATRAADALEDLAVPSVDRIVETVVRER
jgi:hypothetical protein